MVTVVFLLNLSENTKLQTRRSTTSGFLTGREEKKVLFHGKELSFGPEAMLFAEIAMMYF